MKTLQILLVDDHEVVRHGVRRLIESEADLRVCAEASDVQEAVKGAAEHHPDLVLMDAKLREGNSTEACRQIRSICPDTKIMVFSAYADEHTVQEMMLAGVDSYMLKEINGTAIVDAIRGTVNGTAVIAPPLAGTVMAIMSHQAAGKHDLSQRDKRILSLVAAGKTNKEIAAMVGLSEKTIRNSVSRIMRKIGVGNRTEAALYWHRIDGQPYSGQ